MEIDKKFIEIIEKFIVIVGKKVVGQNADKLIRNVVTMIKTI